MNMRRAVVNGFVTDYRGPVFPASSSNRITRDFFFLRGGLENQRNYRIRNEERGIVSYHDISQA